MLIATQSPQETIDRLLEKLVAENPKFKTEDFRLPIDESCNYEPNTISVRNFVPMMKWYLIQRATKSGKPRSEKSDRILLGELVDGIIDNPDEHFVIIDDKRSGLTLDYLSNKENWVSNHTCAAFFQNFAKGLGPEYSDLDAMLSPNNPWFNVSRYALQNPTDNYGIIQQLAVLWSGPRQAYSRVLSAGAYFNRVLLYEVLEDNPISQTRRRIKLMAHWTNKFEVPVEYLGQNLSIFAAIPEIFSYNKILQKIPGFKLGMADVHVNFPDGDYSGRWEIIFDYNITPIDRFKGYLTFKEIYKTTERLSAENIELMRDKKVLEDEVKKSTAQLLQEHKRATLGELGADFAHSLNSPLEGVDAGLALIKANSLYFVQISQEIDKIGLEQELKNDLDGLVVDAYKRSTVMGYIDQEILYEKSKILHDTLKDKYGNITPPMCEKIVAMGYDSDMSKLEKFLPIENSAQIINILKKVFDYGLSVDDIEKHSSMIKDRVTTFSQYSKKSEGKISTVDLNKLISSMLGIYDGRMNMNGINVETDFDKNLGLLECDEKGIEELLGNLLDNAVNALKESKDRKSIKIKTYGENGCAVVEINDTGIGIPPEDISKIYEPFYTKTSEGSGLGLSIATKIIEKHNGSLRHISEPGDTTAKVRIPLAYQGKT